MRRKLIAPIVVTVLVILYVAVYFGALVHLLEGLPRLLLLLIPLAVGAAMVGVLIQRIREIRSGEEDDLSQY
ncbi:MAG: hypothetical protein IKS29_04315 [Oscillospiraceae bacterium]|nr:hypothetical protein [Oscillospiraceae bacterium]